MKLRIPLVGLRAALLSALGATQLACGGRAAFSVDDPRSSGGDRADASTGGVNSGNGGPNRATPGGHGGTSAAGTSTGGTNVAGGGQGGAATAGELGNAGAGPPPFPCTNPIDRGNGFVECDSYLHRQESRTCASQLPRPEVIPDISKRAQCTSDADCKDKPHGWCTQWDEPIIVPARCNYGCVTDSECASHEICECAVPVGHCVAADCSSDADCGSGYLCRNERFWGCVGQLYFCQTAADECGQDADCDPGLPPETVPMSQCVINRETHHLQCVPGYCVVGRPFLVQGAERLAKVSVRADWSELPRLPQLAELDSTQRARLAEHWTQSALMEHASIAAFARFALQLISLGAPAQLIERATAAMADETKHARACFAVASAYAGAPLGPGRLAVAHSLDDSTLEAIVLNTIREGCVGETVAAIEAREAAEHARDPALRALLLEISEDETRHAELAYCFVQWALALGGPELEHAVRREFAECAAEAPLARHALTDWDNASLREGIVPVVMRQSLRAQAFAEVILPCSRALEHGRPRVGVQPSDESTRSSAS